jgi:hypothetical protein
VTALVLRRVITRRIENAAGVPAGTLDLSKIREFTETIHPRIGEYVRTNWSGQTEALPGVLAVILDQVEATAREKGLTFDRDTLKRLIETSLARHGVAKSGQIREALKQVA